MYRYSNCRFFIMIMTILTVLLAQSVIAEDNKPTALSTSSRVEIDGGTEDQITVEDMMYSVTQDAKIYNQSGKKIELMDLQIPCIATVIYEPQAGGAPPLVTGITVIETLPDLSLPENRISEVPE